MTDPHAGRQRPVARYGRAGMPPATRRRVAVTLGFLAAAAGVAVAAMGYQRFVAVDVEGSTGAFTVLDDRSVEVTISVTRSDPSRPVVCIVRAKSSDGAETGRREVLVGPSSARTVQVTTTVKSFRSPSAADLYGCGTDVPGYLVGD